MAPYTIAVVEGLATVHPDHESAVLVILPFGKPHSSCSCHYSYQSRYNFGFLNLFLHSVCWV